MRIILPLFYWLLRSSFLMDISFLARHAPALFNADKVVLVHGMQPGQLESSHLAAVFDAETRRRITLVRPETPHYGTVHAKAMFTFCGEAGCRVLVHSANDIEEDWLCRAQGAWYVLFYNFVYYLASIVAIPVFLEDCSSYEVNKVEEIAREPSPIFCSVFSNLSAWTLFRWRDFELKKPGDASTDFERSLVDYFCAISKGQNSCARELKSVAVPILQQYNFATAGCQLVTSVPGHHGRDGKKDRKQYGLARLQALLSRECFSSRARGGDSSEKKVSVVMQFSSLGSISSKWIDDELHPALFSGVDRIGKNNQRAGDKLEFMLPTLLQVAGSNESLAAGSSLPVRSANIHRDHIRDRLHSWCAERSGRERAMPHIKTIVRYDRDDPSCIDYVYLGSANLSGAAWGWVRKKGKKDEHLHILSYEMGLLFTPETYCPPTFTLGKPGGIAMRVPEAGPSVRHFRFRRVSGGEEWEALNCSARAVQSTCPSEEVCDVGIPLPYVLPPVPYEERDIPWHVDCGQAPSCNSLCRQLASLIGGG